MTTTTATTWTCSRCTVTASWAPGIDSPQMPAVWVSDGDATHCLRCRRELAGESGLEQMPEGSSGEDRQRAKVAAMIEFEIVRDPDRPNGKIAKACSSSVVAVGKVRERLETGV